ncbi:MAG: hypothetical protein IKJ61_01655 [Bacteroidaceae bacterium]|nr:hypothetical protein [Bacteroidaceae bacterium]
MESRALHFSLFAIFEPLDFNPAERDLATQPATYCCRPMFALTTLANRDPHGTNAACATRDLSLLALSKFHFDNTR